ncbi:MAG TPA: saccharopine dehydrogenase C-terminal domain-containing protein [Opitutaceae bacterium]
MRIGIIGAGKVGATIALLLADSAFCSEVILADLREPEALPVLRKARFRRLDAADPASLRTFVRECHAVLCAGPYYLNKGVAEACGEARVAYFDLTEDVGTTQHVRALAAHDGASTFMPQCGLAPGAINVVGGALARQFTEVRSLEMRVGALPLSASNQMKYYLSWSTVGLINEYCQPGEVLYEGRPATTLPLDGLERLTIDGTEYEAFNTSGGVATMCETFAGKVRDLSYKTLRYPGHRDLMKFLLFDLQLNQRRELLTQIFDQEVPLTFDDVVVVYVNAVGHDHDRRLVQHSYIKKIYSTEVLGRRLSAIQLSTAAGAVAMLELFSRRRLVSGFVSQESVPLAEFLSTKWGGLVYSPQNGNGAAHPESYCA